MGYSSNAPGALADRSGPAIGWEEIACPLCGGARWVPLVEAPDPSPAPGTSGQWFMVVQCQECGLCFTNPRPGLDSIGQFYPPAYAPHQGPAGKGRSHLRDLFSVVFSAGNARKVLPLHGQGRLLDFGCGGGSYLQRMHRQGWTVTGLDCAPSAVQRIQADLGFPALVGSLPHPGLQPESFDVITMWQSLEHVHAPLETLRAAHELLAPGGKLYLSVPNIDSLPFRWFGQAWYGLDLPRHLTHFSPWTLRLMLHRAGFRTGRVQMIRHSKWLRSSARLSGRIGTATRLSRWLRGKFAANLATWYTFLARQTDCILATAVKR